MIRDFRATWGDLDLTDAPYLFAFGHNVGAPETLYAVREGLFGPAGQWVTSEATGNREIEFTVYIEGADSAERAAAEMALIRQAERPMSELLLTPPDGWSEPAAFDTYRAQVRHEQDEDADAAGLWRYVVTMPARPFARDAALTVTPALTMPPAETSVSIRDGSSTTGWAAPNEPAWWGVTFSTSGGILSASRTVTDPARVGTFIEALLTVATPASLTATPYVTVRHRVAPGTTVAFWEGNTRMREVVTFVDADGWTEATFISTGWTTLGIVVNAYQFDTTSVAYQFEEITASSHPPVRSSPRQLIRTVTVGGSARTEGSIHVDASSGTVGDCMVYTWPHSWGSYGPVLSPYVGTGAVLVADSTAASGSYRSISTAASWLVPAHLLPAGDYTLVARLKTDAPVDGFRRLRVEVKSWMGATVIGTPVERYVAPWLKGDLVYGLATLGKFTLPPTRVGTDGAVDVILQRRDDETVEIFADELYALHEDGSLTMLAQYGGKHVWIDAPSLAEPKGAVWVGESADGSDKWHASWLAQSWQHHEFAPEGVNMLTVTGGCEYAAVDLTHYRRHHTHVAHEPS